MLNNTENEIAGVRIVGESVAGIGTCFVLPDFDVCFDVANGPAYAHTVNNIFISHTHADHASGLPYILSMRALTHLKNPNIYVAESVAEPLKQIMNIWGKIEGYPYQAQFTPTEEGQDIKLKGEYIMRSFKAFHRIPALGYTVMRRYKKLKPQFEGLSSKEIVKIKESGETVDSLQEEPIVSFSGDTKIEYLDNTPWIANSKVLLTEVTYLDDRKPVKVAREWGHIHLDELIPRLSGLKCEKVVLTHISRRYSPKEAREIIWKKVPPEFHDKIVIGPPHGNLTLDSLDGLAQLTLSPKKY